MQFICSRVFLSSPYIKSLYCCPTSVAATLPLTRLFYQYLSSKCFLLAFQLKTGDFAWGRICHLFLETKKKRKGALVLCIFSPFCLLFLRIFALSTIVVPLHPTQASMPSLCPWGERNRRAWLAKCVRDWDSTAEDEFSTVSFISLPYIDKHSRANT